MDSRTQVNADDLSDADEAGGSVLDSNLPRLGIPDIRRYRVSDSLSGVLIGILIMFSPWAFAPHNPPRFGS